jgi:hypothetical protein
VMNLSEINFEDGRWFELAPMAGFGISGVELSGSITPASTQFFGLCECTHVL